MLQNAFGFSLIMSSIITGLVYVITREKSKSEQEKQDKLNDLIILFVITFVVVLFGKLCVSNTTTTTSTLIKQPEMKGGQCPF